MNLFSSCTNSKCPVRSDCFRFRQKVKNPDYHTYVVGVYDDIDGCDNFMMVMAHDILENFDEEANQGRVPSEVREENEADGEEEPDKGKST